METIALVIIASAFAVILVYMMMKLRYDRIRQKCNHNEIQLSIIKSESEQLKISNDTYIEKCQGLERLLVQVQTELEASKNRLQEEIHNEEKQIRKFENIANNVLRTQMATLGQHHNKGLNDILNPLKEKIQNFEAKIEHSNQLSIERHSSLKEQIHSLSRQSEKVASDANNLAKALKGDFKAQGNWGEVILNNILDKSGLEKGREYFVQQSERTVEGKLLKPDVVIHLPDNKRLVIDSKVSLVSYDGMVSAESIEEQKMFQRAHASAIKSHVQMLASKSYHTLYNMQSPDFVMMFVPIDTAFSAALYFDPNIYDDAFNQNVIIVTSSTLLATLKTVESLWRNEKQNKYAEKIAEEAGKLYDKFVGFVADMEKIGLQLKTVQKSYDSSMKKLSEGSGNMIRRAELVKSLGAKANKAISPKLVEKAQPSITA